jgi:hypothetical protein
VGNGFNKIRAPAGRRKFLIAGSSSNLIDYSDSNEEDSNTATLSIPFLSTLNISNGQSTFNYHLCALSVPCGKKFLNLSTAAQSASSAKSAVRTLLLR